MSNELSTTQTIKTYLIELRMLLGHFILIGLEYPTTLTPDLSKALKGQRIRLSISRP